MKIDDITQKAEEKKLLEKIVALSEEFLQSTVPELNYQKITDDILDISGAKYAAFNLFDEDGAKFRTVAFSAPKGIVKKVSSLIGFELVGKKWDPDPARAEKIKDHTITHFPTLSELSGEIIPKPLISLLEKMFSIGEVVLVKILRENIMIGDFTLMMPKNNMFNIDAYIEIYTRQLGLLITRSRSEAKLVENESRLRSIFATVNDPLFLIDQKTESILDVNDAACNLYGYRHDEMLKLKIIDISAEPEKTKQTVQKLNDAIAVGYHKNKEGNVFPVEFSASLFELSGRKVITASMRDITERLKAEDALKQSNIKYRQLFDNMTTGFALHEMIYDKKGNPIDYRFLEINPAFEKLTGLKASLLIGKTVKDVIPETEQYWIDAYSAVAKTGKSISFQNYAASLKKWYESWVFSPAKNQFATIFSDITERKKVEEEIKSLAKFPEENPHPVGRADYSGKLLFSNNTYKKIFSDNDYVPNKLQGAIKKIAIEKSFDQEIIELKIGERLFSFNIVPIKGEDYINIYGGDITDRKKTEEDLKISYENTEKALGQTIKTLSSIVEIKDPYTSGHQQRVTEIATSIAEEMGLKQDRIIAVRIAATIHDIGKISVPPSILSKPGKLSEIEFELIKDHSESGYNMIKNIEFPFPVAKIVLQHHERINGSGYPKGLKGDDIMLEAKIIAVADVIEAMASHRPYRPALGMDQALKEIEQNKGILYDPEVVDTCSKLIKSGVLDFHENKQDK